MKKTLKTILYELYRDGELAGKINREGRDPVKCVNICIKRLIEVLKEAKNENNIYR